MTISEFIKKYNLHDSLIESIDYDKNNCSVRINIDFCYWQQEYYTDDMQETGEIQIIFSKVSKFECVPVEINCDGIIDVRQTEDNEMYLEFLNDKTEECHSLTIAAESVSVSSIQEPTKGDISSLK